jgi:hypothetical protein
MSGHVDVFPTVLDALGVDLDPLTWSSGRSLLADEVAGRRLVVTGVGFPLRSSRIAVIDRDHRIWLRRRPGGEGFALDRLLGTESQTEVAAEGQPELAAAWLEREMRRFLRTAEARSSLEPPLPVRVEASFGPWLSLRALAQEAPVAEPGAGLRLALAFRCLRAVPADRRLAFRLRVGGAAETSAVEHEPVSGTLPLVRWRPGEYVLDEVLATIPGQAPAGAGVEIEAALVGPQGPEPIEPGRPGFALRDGWLVLARLRLR